MAAQVTASGVDQKTTGGAKVEDLGEPFSVSSYNELASYGLPNRGRGYHGVSPLEWVARKDLYRGTLRSHTLLDAMSYANFREVNLAFTGNPNARPTDMDMRRAMVKWVLKQLHEFNASGRANQADSFDDLASVMWRRLSRGRVPAMTKDQEALVSKELADHSEEFSDLNDVQKQHLAAFLDRQNWPQDGLGQFAMKIIAMMTGLPITQLVALPKTKYAMHELEFEPVPSLDDPASAHTGDTTRADEVANVAEPPRLMLILEEPELAEQPQRWFPVLRHAVNPKQEAVRKDDGRIFHIGKTITEAVGQAVDMPEIGKTKNCLYDSLALMPHIQRQVKEALPVKKPLFRTLMSPVREAASGDIPSAMDVRRELARCTIEWLSEQGIPDLDAEELTPEDREQVERAAELSAMAKGPEAELALRCSRLPERPESGVSLKLNVPEWKGTPLEKKFDALSLAQKKHVLNLLADKEYHNETTDMAPQLAAMLFKCELQVFASGNMVQQGERIPIVTETLIGTLGGEEASSLPRGLLALDGEHYQPMFLKEKAAVGGAA